MIPKGPESPLTDLLIFFLLKDTRFDHNFPNIRKVSFVCAFISCHPATKACRHEKVIGSTSVSLSRAIATHNTHSSTGQVIEDIFVFHEGSLVSTENVFPN